MRFKWWYNALMSSCITDFNFGGGDDAPSIVHRKHQCLYIFECVHDITCENSRLTSGGFQIRPRKPPDCEAVSFAGYS